MRKLPRTALYLVYVLMGVWKNMRVLLGPTLKKGVSCCISQPHPWLTQRDMVDNCSGPLICSCR